jgi:hypothetical protein
VKNNLIKTTRVLKATSASDHLNFVSQNKSNKQRVYHLYNIICANVAKIPKTW